MGLLPKPIKPADYSKFDIYRQSIDTTSIVPINIDSNQIQDLSKYGTAYASNAYGPITAAGVNTVSPYFTFANRALITSINITCPLLSGAVTQLGVILQFRRGATDYFIVDIDHDQAAKLTRMHIAPLNLVVEKYDVVLMTNQYNATNGVWVVRTAINYFLI